MTKSSKRSEASLLRQRAEDVRTQRTANSATPSTDAEMQKLVHELEVHQIELEMQNEELQRARSAANDLAEKYVELYDMAPTGYMTLSITGEIRQLNFACARMLGKERARLMHDPFRQYVGGDFRPAFDAFFRDVVENNTTAMCEVVLSANGSSPVMVQLTGILSSGNQQLMVTIVDITERMLAEEKLRLSEQTYRGILDMVTEVVYIEDADGKILNVNRAAEEMFGYGKGELIGRTLEFLAGEGEHEIAQLRSHYKTALRDRHHSFEFMGRHASGMLFPIEVNLSVGQYFGQEVIIAVARDITHRKEMDQLIRDVQRREAIGVLSAGIAHDFNNLLAVMMGNVSLAQTKLHAEHPASPLMKNAELAMKRAAELTKQILAYSGKGKNQTETIDLGAEIEQHVSLFTITMPKNVKLITHIPATPIHVCGDPGQIKQIIMNLISNGADAIGDRKGTVSIALKKIALERDQLVPYNQITNAVLNEGNYALLEISDDGAGMNHDTIANIFDPFFTTKFTGRGLGLSAVLGIIRGHDGGISIESKEQVGSVFRVILPVCAPHESETAPVSAPSDTASLMRATILVIDDEAEVAAMTKELLESVDYTVMMELDPRRAIELYSQHQSEIGMVLLDWTMPELSGKDVADSLRAINPAVKIIISSGYSADEIRTKVNTATVCGYLQKPYTLQSLLSTVRSVMT